MGKRGRKPVPKDDLFNLAQTLYRDFWRLEHGWPHSPDGSELDDALVALSQKDKDDIERRVDDGIRRGRLRPGQKAQRLRAIEQEQLRVFWQGQAEGWKVLWEQKRKTMWDAQPDEFYALLKYTSVDVIRSICAGAFSYMSFKLESGVSRTAVVRKWPIPRTSPLPRQIAQYAKQFVAARKDPRFPRSHRPTSRLKQMWFLSRALAGARFALKTRTAINLIGSKRPEQILKESHDAKPSRKQTK